MVVREAEYVVCSLQFKLNDANRSGYSFSTVARLRLSSEAFLHVRIVTSNVNCATEIVVVVVVAISLTRACTQQRRRRRSGSTYQLGVYCGILTHRTTDRHGALFRVSMSSTVL